MARVGKPSLRRNGKRAVVEVNNIEARELESGVLKVNAIEGRWKNWAPSFHELSVLGFLLVVSSRKESVDFAFLESIAFNALVLRNTFPPTRDCPCRIFENTLYKPWVRCRLPSALRLREWEWVLGAIGGLEDKRYPPPKSGSELVYEYLSFVYSGACVDGRTLGDSLGALGGRMNKAHVRFKLPAKFTSAPKLRWEYTR
jgi:hypothetical protein